ncbi:hypothetical protein [Reichenbachiella sp. MALMAid0571]|uniref:hypothetical protein n=1 Tax=Reichenbachiella sp. MALMAid0571 TaxID=3143939 RepID=UPI0032DF6739
MKKIILFTLFALSTVLTESFAQTTPKKEFTVKLSETDISILPGKTQIIDVTINRSKSYSKTQIDLSISSTLPEGISISFKDGTDPLTQKQMIVTASEDAMGISKTLVLNAKSSRATKGVMFKLKTSETIISNN